MRTGRYFGVIWGDNIRLSLKVDSERSACFHCYGLFLSEMEVIDLGSNQNKAMEKFEKVRKGRKLKVH